MIEEIDKCLEEAKTHMKNAVIHLEKELQKTRAGRASQMMLDGIRVDYYGTITPLNQVASISTPDARTLVIQPWDRNILTIVEKAIQIANLGFNPINDGMLLRIQVPPLTEERRKELSKKVKAEGENAKIAVRNLRRDANEKAKLLEKKAIPEDLIKKLETDIQEQTNYFISMVDKVIAAKEKEIMTV